MAPLLAKSFDLHSQGFSRVDLCSPYERARPKERNIPFKRNQCHDRQQPILAYHEVIPTPCKQPCYPEHIVFANLHLYYFRYSTSGLFLSIVPGNYELCHSISFGFKVRNMTEFRHAAAQRFCGVCLEIQARSSPKGIRANVVGLGKGIEPYFRLIKHRGQRPCLLRLRVIFCRTVKLRKPIG